MLLILTSPDGKIFSALKKEKKELEKMVIVVSGKHSFLFSLKCDAISWCYKKIAKLNANSLQFVKVEIFCCNQMFGKLCNVCLAKHSNVCLLLLLLQLL